MSQQLAITGPMLGAGTLLLLLAGWRRWSPPLAVAVLVALALRVAVAAAAVHFAHHLLDFRDDFPRAGEYTRQHRDSLALFEDHRWHWLPPLAYVFALSTKLRDITGLPWSVVGRGAPIIADLIVMLLVARLAGPQHGRLRALQYAGNPVAILVCAWHGQVEPFALVCVVPAFLAANRRRDGLAGCWLGLAEAVQGWPLLLAPGLLIGARHRWRMLAGILGVPAAFFVTLPWTFGTPWHGLLRDALPLIDVRPAGPSWGWRAVLEAGGGSSYPAVAARVALIAVAVAVAWACWHWRRAAQVDRGVAGLIAEMIVAPRFGGQYLLWPMPLMVAQPTRMTPLFIVLAGAWAGTSYLHPMVGTDKMWWQVSSLVVIAALAAAAPWRRTGAHRRAGRGPRAGEHTLSASAP